MIIKKFQGNTETEAIMLAKENLGKDAIIMNIKTIKPKGLFRIFRKTIVEVTAAVDEINDKQNKKESETTSKIHATIDGKLHPELNKSEESDKETKELEDKLNSLAMLVEEQIEKQRKEDHKQSKSVKSNKTGNKDSYKDVGNDFNTESKKEYNKDLNKETNKDLSRESNKDDKGMISLKEKSVDLIINQLTTNEVAYNYAKQIIDEVMHAGNIRTLDDMLGYIYQKIILKLGQTKPISFDKNDKKPKVIFFVGPTGVGKTTTIAKLSSKLLLEEKKKIAIITADTYRIAAVEQIKTYANILSIPVEVIYETKDIEKALPQYKEYDYILIDTAGRSHKNKNQTDDLKILFDAFKDYSILTYLVLSATTKYKDLQKITKLYSDITDFSIIFTKLDETDAVGNILNVKLDTGMPLSYVSYGQNVPDDIEIMNPQVIAKQLLGGGDGYGSGR